MPCVLNLERTYIINYTYMSELDSNIYDTMAFLHNDGELLSFLVDVEEAIIRIHDSVVGAANESDVEDILIHAELLLRDTIIVESFLLPQDGQLMVNIVAMMVRSLHDFCDEFQRSHMRGRPQIPISEDQLVYLLEFTLQLKKLHFCWVSHLGPSDEELFSLGWKMKLTSRI